MKAIHFFVARKADGAPLFMRNQGTLGTLEELHGSITTSLLCRDDMDHATIHQVTGDAGAFVLVETLRRDASTGFYPCHCGTLVYQRCRCERCKQYCCSEHRKPDPKKMLAWLCNDCVVTPEETQ